MKDTLAEPADIMAAVALEADALDAYLAGLSAADLERPSACAAWTVAEVVAHLALGGRRYAGRLGRALEGQLTRESPATSRRITSADIAAAARAARGEMGRSVREALREANALLVARLATLSPDDWQRPSGSPVGPVYRLAQMRVFELALHGWDIRSALDPPARLPRARLPILVDYLGRWFGLTFRPDVVQASPLRLRFEWADRDWPAYDLLVEATGVDFGPAATGAADRAVRCDPEDLVLLATGRIDAARGGGEGAAGVSALAGLFRSRFPAL